MLGGAERSPACSTASIYILPVCLSVCSTDQATAESTDRDFVVIYGSLGILQSLTFLVAVLHMNRLSVAASALIHRTTLSREDAWTD